jgi:hypothetical protein
VLQDISRLDLELVNEDAEISNLKSQFDTLGATLDREYNTPKMEKLGGAGRRRHDERESAGKKYKESSFGGIVESHGSLAPTSMPPSSARKSLAPSSSSGASPQLHRSTAQATPSPPPSLMVSASLSAPQQPQQQQQEQQQQQKPSAKMQSSDMKEVVGSKNVSKPPILPTPTPKPTPTPTPTPDLDVSTSTTTASSTVQPASGEATTATTTTAATTTTTITTMTTHQHLSASARDPQHVSVGVNEAGQALAVEMVDYTLVPAKLVRH